MNYNIIFTLLAMLTIITASCSRHDKSAKDVKMVDTDSVIAFGRQAIVAYEQQRGPLQELIQSGDTNAIAYFNTLGQLRDEWDTSIRFTVTSNGWEIRSAGPDRIFGTNDDRT
jgi:hypothetical protein